MYTPDPGQEEKKSPKAGETEQRHRFGGASDLFQVVGPTTEKETALCCRKEDKRESQIALKTAFYGSLLHKKREGGKARADRRAPSQICTATPSGVVTFGALGHVPPSRFTDCVFCSCCQFNC